MRAYRLLVTVPALVLFGAAVSFVVALAGPDLPVPGATIAGKVGLAFSLMLCISPVALVLIAIFLQSRIRRAVATRACDLVLTGDEVRVSGGPANGFTAPLRELAGDGGVRFSPAELTVRRNDGMRLRVPVPPDADERASLEALASVLSATALARVHGGSAPEREPPNLIRCQSCGAPLPPAASAQVRCPYCHAENALPAALVAKVQAAERLRRQHERDEQLCRSLLKQPSARVANVVAFGGGLAVLLVAALAAFLGGAFFMIDGKEAGLPRWAGVGLIEMGVALLPLAFVRRVLSNRRALRILTLGFAAMPPQREGGLSSCRNCGGPLPNVEPRVVLSRCGYCGAENLRLADFRVHASIIDRFAGQHQSPGEALRAVVRARRRAFHLGLAGVSAIAIGFVWLLTGPKPPPLDAAAVTVPFEESLPPRDPPAPAAFDAKVQLSEEAFFPGKVLALLSAANGQVAVVVQGAKSARVVEAPRGEVTPEALRAAPEVPLGVTYDRRSPGGALLIGGNDRVSCVSGGKTTLLYGDAVLSDRLIVDVAAAGAGCSGYVTTRASKEGHLRVRFLNGSGSVRVRADTRQPALSPSGRDLAVTLLERDHGHFQLAILPAADHSDGRLVTKGRGHVAHPIWSPDGTRVAFLSQSVRDSIQYSERFGRIHLFMTDLKGSLVQLTTGGDLALIRPLWTEQGIYVVTSESYPVRRSRLLRIAPS